VLCLGKIFTFHFHKMPINPSLPYFISLTEFVPHFLEKKKSFTRAQKKCFWTLFLACQRIDWVLIENFSNGTAMSLIVDFYTEFWEILGWGLDDVNCIEFLWKLRRFKD
jgi:hypothetical protein